MADKKRFGIMSKKRFTSFSVLNFLCIVASVTLLPMGCSNQPSFFTPDKIRELEGRLKAVGIIAHCEGENYANQQSGQGIGLVMEENRQDNKAKL